MTQEVFDIVVVGGGAAGLAAALGVAGKGRTVCLVGAIDTRADGRTIALLDGSVRFLDSLGAWAALAPQAAPLRTMRLIDDSGSLFRPPPVDFQAGEIGLEAFGWNIENAALVAGLAAALTAAGVAHRPASATGLAIGRDGASLTLDDGSHLQAKLVVAADGRRSLLREAAGIKARTWAYPQAALTTRLAHDRDHGEVSTEFHTRHGPFTLVPLPGRRSSLVWVTRTAKAEALAALADADLARAIEDRCQAMLGAMRIDGPRGVVPMTGLSVERYTAPRLALLGEAAHVFPPIGAQGLNLSFRDADALRQAVSASPRDPGAPAVLRVYERDRAGDVPLRTRAVDALNRSLLAEVLPVDFLRGAGLLTLAQIAPLRRALMRAGLQPAGRSG